MGQGFPFGVCLIGIGLGVQGACMLNPSNLLIKPQTLMPEALDPNSLSLRVDTKKSHYGNQSPETLFSSWKMHPRLSNP